MIFFPRIYLKELTSIWQGIVGRLVAFPSPLPSPKGRGRIIFRLATQLGNVVAKRPSAMHESANRCSLSHRPVFAFGFDAARQAAPKHSAGGRKGEGQGEGIFPTHQ